ncbi:MAG: PEGA domain-containing protein [Gammaproteobacteria bacterium]
MSRVYFIHDARGERRAGETELPLCVGGELHGDVVLPEAPAAAVIAYIAEADGHAYIQPADASEPLFHNHELLTDSRWLKSGDQVQAGEALLDWTVKGDQVFITARIRPAAVELSPPSGLTPGAPRSGIAPVITGTVRPRRAHRLRYVVAAGFTLLVLAAAFVLLATPVAVTITPEPATQSLNGFPPVVRIGRRLLALPGEYTVRASLSGYRPLEERIRIQDHGFQAFDFRLQSLPGRVRIVLEPDVPFRLFAGDDVVTPAADGVAELAKGTAQLRVETERYLPESREVEIAGRGQAQTVAFTLRPAWAGVHIGSRPAGAAVQVDGVAVGITPLDTEILAGTRRIALTLPGHKPVSLTQQIVAGAVLQLENIELPPADGSLSLDSEPPGASVSVDGVFQGTTPLQLVLSSNTAHTLHLTKPGYQTGEQRVTLAPEEQQDLRLTLSPQYGTVFVTARPADATLTLDGTPAGAATRRLRLTTRAHQLEFSKPGYASQTVSVTPRAGASQNVDVTLKSAARARTDATPATVKTTAGQVLKLVSPGEPFEMGASRREAGRRANESRRLVQLTRPYYLGVREVTNGEFRRFDPAHDSGTGEGAGLNDDAQPVVSVSWEAAARYCNWLSGQDGLLPAYAETGGKLVPVVPATQGYRLPTEAEWVYAARVVGREAPARFPWPGSYPPKAVAGNFADARLADTLASVVPSYDDGYRGTAPVGSFPVSPGGFHDLGGNVAEWTNDYYTVYPGEAGQLVRDPAGPATGDHHVVRDSSWRQGSISELRLSYRDYSRGPRNDLGFRIARSAR